MHQRVTNSALIVLESGLELESESELESGLELESQSALLAEYVRTYKYFDSVFYFALKVRVKSREDFNVLRYLTKT